MDATSLNPECEMEQLISDQIHIFKDTAKMDDRDLLEYHLRHFRIMTLYQEMRRAQAARTESERWNPAVRALTRELTAPAG